MPYKTLEQQREYQSKWNRKNFMVWKQKAIDILGGKCKRCGYNENIFALQIDHIIPKTKRVSGINLLRQVISGKETSENVQLLCANCHCIKTYLEDRKHFDKERVNLRSSSNS